MPGDDAQAALRAVGGVGEGVDGRDLEGEFDPAHSRQVDGEAEQVGPPGEWWQRPGEGERKVEFVGWLLVLGEENDGVLEGEEDAGVDVEGEVEVQGAATPLLGVQVDLPDLPQGVGLDEVSLVVHVKAVDHGMVFELGHVAGDVNGSHGSDLSGGLGWLGSRVVDTTSLQKTLREASGAVRSALSIFDGHGLSGGRPTQYGLDLVADDAACSVLLGAGLAVFSEESGHRGEGELLVVIDPVDGSTNADRGIPFCCVSLCILDETGPLVALVESLPTGVIYEAVRGDGATRDGKLITTSGAVSEDGIVVGVNGILSTRSPWAQVRTLGAAALEMCLVADGALDAYVQAGGAAIHPWDYLAALLIVEEAGGCVQEQDGAELVIRVTEPRRPVAAASAQLCDVLVQRAPF